MIVGDSLRMVHGKNTSDVNKKNVFPTLASFVTDGIHKGKYVHGKKNVQGSTKETLLHALVDGTRVEHRF